MPRAATVVTLTAAMAATALLLGCGDDEASTPAAAPQTASVTTAETTATGASLVPGCTTAPPPTPASPKRYDAPPPLTIDPAKTYTARMVTSCGTIVIRLDAAKAPNTVNNFVFLAREGFYDGLTFHRVVRDFVVQGGDPTGQGSGDAGYEFEDELPSDGYQLGSVAMANAGPNTNGSQFFIVTGPNGTQLPNDYSKFGRVVQGLDAAQRIEQLAPDDPSVGTPKQPVYIESVTITER